MSGQWGKTFHTASPRGAELFRTAFPAGVTLDDTPEELNGSKLLLLSVVMSSLDRAALLSSKNVSTKTKAKATTSEHPVSYLENASLFLADITDITPTEAYKRMLGALVFLYPAP